MAIMAQKGVLEILRRSLETNSHSGTFAWGGEYPFNSAAHGLTEEEEVAEYEIDKEELDAVDIRFGENGKGTKLTLPGSSSHAEERKVQLQQLTDMCLPVEFGNVYLKDGSVVRSDLYHAHL